MIKSKDLKGVKILYAMAVMIVGWYIFSLIISKPILPSPFLVIQNIFKNFSKEMGLHVFYSLYRIFLGLLFSIIIGVSVGVKMGYYKRVDKILSPILYFNYPVPKMALLPICMLIFGLGDFSKILMIFLITFFPITLNVRDVVKNIPEEVISPLLSVGANDLDIIVKVILPGIIPAILSSLRIGIGTSISVLFFTENFGTQYGMGYYIMDSWMRINYVQMYSGIVMLSTMGILLFLSIDLIEGKLRWLS